MIRRPMMFTAVLVLGACAGSKAPAPDTSAGAQPAPAVAAPPADGAQADTTKPASDAAASAAEPAATPAATPAPKPDVTKPATLKPLPAKPDSVGFDIAIKPKYTVDEKTGKITPIKKP